MRKIYASLLLTAMILTFMGCMKREVKIVVPEESALYQEDEIYDAMEFVIAQYTDKHDLTLYSVSYAGDEKSEKEKEYYLDRLKAMDGDQVIVLKTAFRVSRTAKGAWEPGAVYRNFEWILGRNVNGPWHVISSGYA